MNLTEKEARKKECPYRFSRDPDRWTTLCVASECMAWRTSMNNSGGHVMKQVAPPTPCKNCGGAGHIDGDCCAECEGDGNIGHFERTGYCGLAGKPES